MQIKGQEINRAYSLSLFFSSFILSHIIPEW